jgi:hypothetical protein
VVNHQESITADFCNKICQKQTVWITRLVRVTHC